LFVPPINADTIGALWFPGTLALPGDIATVDLGVQCTLITATHHVLFSLVLLTVYPSVKLGRPRAEVHAASVVHRVCLAGNAKRVSSILLAEKIHNHTFCSCRAAIARSCVDLDGVDQNLAGDCRAFVVCYVTDWSECVAIIVAGASTKVFSSTMATHRVVDWAVAIVIQPSTTNCTIFPSTIEAVLVVWNVTDFVESFAHRIVIVAPKVFNASIFPVADVSGRTIFIFFATTKMIGAANREKLRAVEIVIQSSTSNCTIFAIAIEAVLMVWNVADLIVSRAISIGIVASKVFNTAVFPVADVSGWTIFIVDTTAKMIMAAIAANWVELRAVTVVNATWFAGHIVTVEAVFMVRNVTKRIMARAVVIQLVATIWNALLVVAIAIQVSSVTDLSSLTIFVGIASAKVLRASMTTDWVRPWTVVVCGTTFCAIC